MAHHVGAKNFVGPVGREVQNRVRPSDPGIVDEDGGRAQCLADFFGDSGDQGSVADVALKKRDVWDCNSKYPSPSTRLAPLTVLDAFGWWLNV